MPVERYRSAEELNAAPVRPGRGDPFERFVRHCRRYWLLFPRRYPRGVFKFRTVQEAQAARDRVSQANAGA
jgi:hypothetical protein